LKTVADRVKGNRLSRRKENTEKKPCWLKKEKGGRVKT